MIRTTIIAALLVAAAPAALAEDPEDFIKYRQAVMKAIGGHTGAASQIVRGKVNPEGALGMHANALAELSKDLTGLFPEGSDFGETKAKEEIWSDWAKFEKAADDARTATAAFAERAVIAAPPIMLASSIVSGRRRKPADLSFDT